MERKKYAWLFDCHCNDPTFLIYFMGPHKSNAKRLGSCVCGMVNLWTSNELWTSFYRIICNIYVSVYVDSYAEIKCKGNFRKRGCGVTNYREKQNLKMKQNNDTRWWIFMMGLRVASSRLCDDDARCRNLLSKYCPFFLFLRPNYMSQEMRNAREK